MFLTSLKIESRHVYREASNPAERELDGLRHAKFVFNYLVHIIYKKKTWLSRTKQTGQEDQRTETLS